MIRLIHAADVHLRQDEPEYGLAILREIVALVGSERADFLLFSGDLFNTFTDAEALHRQVRETVAPCAAEILYIPGNHETHHQHGALDKFDFGKLRPLVAAPFSLLTRMVRDEPIEFLAVPHGDRYGAWRDWGIPPRQGDCRVALAHATVETMAYTGPRGAQPEEDGGIIGSEFFTRSGVTYAALGHIHDRREVRQGATLLAYAGSASVWRRGETGPRTVNIVDLDGAAATRREQALVSAGEYREVEIPLSLDGTLPDLAGAIGSPAAADLLAIRFTGIIENEHDLRALTETVRRHLARQIRVPEISGQEVQFFSGLAQLPLATAFLKKLHEAPPPGLRPEVLARARELALLSIRNVLRGQA